MERSSPRANVPQLFLTVDTLPLPHGRAVLRPVGELDLDSCERLAEAVDAQLDGGRAWLILDMSALTFLDPTGASVLAESSAKAARDGGQLALAAVRPQPAKVIEITGLDANWPCIWTPATRSPPSRRPGTPPRHETAGVSALAFPRPRMCHDRRSCAIWMGVQVALRFGRRIWPASIAAVFAAVSLAASCSSATAGLTSAESTAAQPVCHPVKLPVGISSLTPESYTVRGTLCTPGGTATPATVQVLVPGATYSDVYWDFPYDPAKYSYERAMLGAGYATLNFDPLGFGISSHPLSALVSMQTQAYVVHQVIQAARNGIVGLKFPHVIVVAHSMGTAVAWREAAAYHDEDGLIATGNSHRPSLVKVLEDSAMLYPAFLDPRFKRSHLDPGYLTTVPGKRGELFYNRADASPAVIAEDEATKDTITAAYLVTYSGEDVDLDTSRIHVPVLTAVGQDDGLMCTSPGAGDCSTSSAYLRSEAPFYSPQSCLQAYVLPEAGHDIDLSLNNQLFFQVAERWANRWVGSSGPQPAHHCNGPVGPARWR